VRHSFIKNSGEKEREGSKIYICRTLGWSSDFPKDCGEPQGCIRSLTGLVKDPLKSMVKNPLYVFVCCSAYSPKNKRTFVQYFFICFSFNPQRKYKQDTYKIWVGLFIS
jgi:hypothetical protein